jgi:hypothetical protein
MTAFWDHTLLEVLDVLSFNPVSPLDHALALATYGKSPKILSALIRSFCFNPFPVVSG